MTELLELARQKGDALAKQSEDLSELINNAERFFSGIENYRHIFSKDFDDFGYFIADAKIIVQALEKKNDKIRDELIKIAEFIEFGNLLINSRGNL